MIIEIDGRNYLLEELEKMIQDAKGNINDVSSLLPGDKIWIVQLLIHDGINKFTAEIIQSNWTGSTREYQLLEDGKLFRTATAAKEKINDMYKACFDVYMS